MRIIIIDDNISMRKVLGALFLSQGHEVLAALADGEMLEACLARLQPELICLDYHLPGRDGLALMNVIHRLAPGVAVLFMTASSQDDIQQQATDAGVSGFIHKPFSPQQILDELGNVSQLQQMMATLDFPAMTSATTKQRGNAVLADDSASVRLALKAMLEDAGIKVLQAVSNGREAIVAAVRHQPDLVFLDINMPVMGGFDALVQIRQLCPASRVVMISGAAEKQVVTQSASLGAVGYILKPLKLGYVESVASKLLD